MPVEKWDDVPVLPATAVVREGGEAYVFRQNGELFERRPVRVLHEDGAQAVLAGDSAISAGNYVAHAGAGALNRALKARAAGAGPGHGHDHHGHSHDH